MFPSSSKIIYTKCPDCQTPSAVVVDKASYDSWWSGTLIQDAFPGLSADDREKLITGICPDCWKKLEDEDKDYFMLKGIVI